MNELTIALFGEAEKGAFNTIYYCTTLQHLSYYLGNPPHDSKGLYFAVQALLYHNNLLFCRVKEEGYSASDYLNGLQLLEQAGHRAKISAICFPGVGSCGIISAASALCTAMHCVLVTNEADFYDYLTDSP